MSPGQTSRERFIHRVSAQARWQRADPARPHRPIVNDTPPPQQLGRCEDCDEAPAIRVEADPYLLEIFGTHQQKRFCQPCYAAAHAEI